MKYTPSAETVKCSEKDNDKASVKPFRLLDLPAELRNRVYEFVVYHEENDGFIAPVLFNPKEDISSMGQFFGVLRGQRQELKYICMVGDAEERISRRDPYIYEAIKAHLASGGRVDDKVFRTNIKPLNVFNWNETFDFGHLCSLNCLMQPEVTKVSRQLREETLPLFYGIHKFHLELSNNWVVVAKPVSASPSYRGGGMWETRICVSSTT